MGRRKIEIKAIKDDRNRSVTFLKRKGGLFKKAHELAVLCSVDVAVIIFGHNKKLYEFSSGNINETLNRYGYVCQTYGGPHEHKGPEDFNGKKDAGSDEEDEEPGSPRVDSHSPPQHSLMQQHLQQQAAFQHMGTPSASPPLQNGAFHHRNASPGPQHISRPDSRTHMRHGSAHLIPPPPHHMHPSQSPQPPQGSFAYMPNPPIYNPQQAAVMQARSVPAPPQPPQILYPPTQHGVAPPPPPPPPQQFHPQPPTLQHPQMQQVQMQEPRRQSMPPAIPAQQEQKMQVPAPIPSPPHQQQFSPPMPQPKPLSTAAKTHSIFTPIDDSRSLLAQHWKSSTTITEEPSEIQPKDLAPRSQSIDVGSIQREGVNGIARPPIKTQTAPTSNPGGGLHPPTRTFSTPVINHIPAQAPSRTNSLGLGRPRLKVQIPSEHSDDESTRQGTADSTPPGATAGAATTTANSTLTPVREGAVHLPPPSPSASALLSAGATGPPNPFARPPPPTSSNGFGSRANGNDLETPISALPSRFVSDQLLPSPSGFYNDWGFGRDSNMLPSPLTFQTPVVGTGPSFLRDEAATTTTTTTAPTSSSSEGGERKRKIGEAETPTTAAAANAGAEKRVKA